MTASHRRAPRKRGGSSKKISNSLVALSSAAVLTVYTAGYLRTQSAAELFAEDRLPPRVAGAAETASPTEAPAEAVAGGELVAPSESAVIANPPRPIAPPAGPERLIDRALLVRRAQLRNRPPRIHHRCPRPCHRRSDRPRSAEPPAGPAAPAAPAPAAEAPASEPATAPAPADSALHSGSPRGPAGHAEESVQGRNLFRLGHKPPRRYPGGGRRAGRASGFGGNHAVPDALLVYVIDALPATGAQPAERLRRPDVGRHGKR